MASIPCASFSARKIHENIIKEQARATFARDEANSQKQNVTSACKHLISKVFASSDQWCLQFDHTFIILIIFNAFSDSGIIP